MHQKHDFRTTLTVTAEAVAEALRKRAHDLERSVHYAERTASRWPRDWKAADSIHLHLLRHDLARARTDEALHLHSMQARARALNAGLDRVEALIDALPDNMERSA